MSTNHLKSFLSGESGAVTVDWVVLTAALVGLGLAVISVVSGGLENLSGDINDQLEQDHVNTGFGAGDTEEEDG
ncbi:pilus assembly protein [Rhodobacteraceae bacterium W635]|uniref:pilus assembly protein n=1 Tax=Nioella halotolerans TaxID=2303578 RepID=UPI000E3D0E08|nr:pilus assembly protein [Rhodobacteraceae bacterium W635]